MGMLHRPLSRRVLVGALGGYGALLLAACSSAPSPTAAPAKPAAAAEPTKPAAAPATAPAATTAPAAAPAAAAPTTAAPAAAAKPGVAGGTLTFVLENDVIDFDPMRSRAFVD